MYSLVPSNAHVHHITVLLWNKFDDGDYDDGDGDDNDTVDDELSNFTIKYNYVILSFFSEILSASLFYSVEQRTLNVHAILVFISLDIVGHPVQMHANSHGYSSVSLRAYLHTYAQVDRQLAEIETSV